MTSPSLPSEYHINRSSTGSCATTALTPSAALTAAVIEGFFHKWFRVLVGLVVAVVYRKRLFPAEVEQTLHEMDAARANRRQAATPETV